MRDNLKNKIKSAFFVTPHRFIFAKKLSSFSEGSTRRTLSHFFWGGDIFLSAGMGKVKSIGTFTPNIFICCQRVGRVAPKLASLYFAFYADVT